MSQGFTGTSSAAHAERHVFTTPDGSVRPGVRWIGRLVALALVAWVAALIAGGSGFATLPQLPSYIAAHGGTSVFASATHAKILHASTNRS